MKKIIGILIILLVVALTLNQAQIKFCISSPETKFAIAVADDLKLLEKTHFLPPAWQKIKKIELTSDASHVSNWLNEHTFEIAQKKDGDYILEIFVSEWIDGYRYGALVEYDLVDIKNKNTVWELNRTYKLGILY